MFKVRYGKGIVGSQSQAGTRADRDISEVEGCGAQRSTAEDQISSVCCVLLWTPEGLTQGMFRVLVCSVLGTFARPKKPLEVQKMTE